jgi:hypothetical protein
MSDLQVLGVALVAFCWGLIAGVMVSAWRLR